MKIQQFLFAIILILVSVCIHYGSTDPFAITPDIATQPTCVLERVKKRLGYTCANKNLREIPNNLRSGTEILDISMNRIRDLNQQSFAKYRDLKFLYLFDNMIQTIEEGTFGILTELETIDLSLNALTTLPLELFQLPLLRKLYAHSNNLHTINDDLQNLQKPIKAPFQYLNLANCHLNYIPDFGILPALLEFNVSSNPLAAVEPQQFSTMCSLKEIDLKETPLAACTCLIKLEIREIASTINGLPRCNNTIEEQHYCSNFLNSSLKTPQFYECSSIKKAIIQNEQAKSTWLIVVLSLSGFLIGFVGILYVIHRRNVKQMKRNQKIATQAAATNNNPKIPEEENRETLLTFEKS